MFFLFFNNINIKFAECEKLIQRFYDTAEALSITSSVKLTKKNEFAKITLNKNSETFVIYVVILELLTQRRY